LANSRFLDTLPVVAAPAMQLPRQELPDIAELRAVIEYGVTW
jgi:hypothetical protein